VQRALQGEAEVLAKNVVQRARELSQIAGGEGGGTDGPSS
jgi:hypothetical protein